MIALEMWKKVIATCEENNCFRILAISNIDRPLPAADVFNSADFFASVGLNEKYRLAVVAKNTDVHESHQIAALALKNKTAGALFPAAAFESEWEARHWLQEEA